MRRLWRVLTWLAGTILFVAGVAGVLAFAFFEKFYPSPPKPDYPPPRDLAMAQRQDLDYFRQYLDLNQAYTAVTREAARQLLVRTDPKAGTMTPAEFELAIARMVALSDSGHATFFMTALSRLNNRLPCRLYHFADGFYVVRARAGCVPLLGGKVIAIDGQPVEQIADGMYPYSMGPRNHYDQYKSVAFLESPELLYAAKFADADDQLTLTVQLRDGLRREITITADPPDPNAPRVYSDAYLSPEAIKDEGADWQPLLPSASEVPLFLRDYENPFHSRFWREHGIYYLQFRANADDNGHSIMEFISRVERELVADKPRVVILDLRFDQGGNLVSTADLMQRLPNMEGVQHVYLLTSAWTFSAGLVSAAVVKDAGRGKVTIIGETVGDRLRFWAEGGGLTLPNSKLQIGFATGLHDYTGSCLGESGCFWIQLLIHPRPTSLEPDVAVPFSFADYVARRDPLLETALKLAAARGSARH